MNSCVRLTVFIIILCSCISNVGAQPAIENLVFNVQNNNVLRYDIVFNTSTPARAYAIFGQGNLDRHSEVTPIDVNHQITLYGLVPDANYSFQVFAFDSLGESSSSILNFSTGSLPPSILSPNPPSLNLTEEGYYAVNLESAPERQTNIIDRNGQVVWYEFTEVPGAPCTGFFWTPSNTLLHLYEDCHTLREVNLKGDLLREVTFPDSLFLHHEFFISDEDRILAVVAAGRIIDKTPVGGPSEALVVGDGFVELDWDGNLYNYWTVFDYFDPLTSEDNGAFWDSYFGDNSEDWLHANSLSIDFDGHYLFGLNYAHQVLKIHRATGEIIWTFGLGGDFVFEQTDDIFLQQHAFLPTEKDQYLLFDNLGFPGVSRTLEFELNTENFSAKREGTYGEQVDVFTPVVGNSIRLPNGNTTTVFGQKGRLVEENINQEIVWDLSYDAFTYRGYYLPKLDPTFPEWQLLDSVICLEPSGAVFPDPFYPQSNLPGGYFEGEGIVNGLFDANLAGFGNHLVTYHYGPIEATTFIYVDSFPGTPSIIQQGDLLTTNTGNRWQWYLNDAPISGATSNNHLAVEPGQYKVAALSQGGCPNFSEPVQIDVLATQTISNSLYFRVYPNPTDGSIIIESEDASINILQIFDLNGQLLDTKEIQGLRKIAVDLAVYPKGWYYIRGKSKNGVYQQLLIKQ